METNALTKIVGSAVVLIDLFDADIDSMAKYWESIGEPCSDDEVEEAKKQLHDMKNDKYQVDAEEDRVKSMLIKRIKHHGNGLKYAVSRQNLALSPPGVGVRSDHDLSTFPDDIYMYSWKSNDYIPWGQCSDETKADKNYEQVSIKGGKEYPMGSDQDEFCPGDLNVHG